MHLVAFIQKDAGTFRYRIFGTSSWGGGGGCPWTFGEFSQGLAWGTIARSFLEVEFYACVHSTNIY